jgi:hypothetical protein
MQCFSILKSIPSTLLDALFGNQVKILTTRVTCNATDETHSDRLAFLGSFTEASFLSEVYFRLVWYPGTE